MLEAVFFLLDMQNDLHAGLKFVFYKLKRISVTYDLLHSRICMTA